MTDLKPCPFCAAVPEENPKGRTQCSCTIGYMLVEHWNSRPIEDRLRAALERIENETSMGTHMSPPIRDMAREALK